MYSSSTTDTCNRRIYHPTVAVWNEDAVNSTSRRSTPQLQRPPRSPVIGLPPKSKTLGYMRKKCPSSPMTATASSSLSSTDYDTSHESDSSLKDPLDRRFFIIDHLQMRQTQGTADFLSPCACESLSLGGDGESTTSPICIDDLESMTEEDYDDEREKCSLPEPIRRLFEILFPKRQGFEEDAWFNSYATGFTLTLTPSQLSSDYSLPSLNLSVSS